MNLIDWRELYAANLATIQASRHSPPRPATKPPARASSPGVAHPRPSRERQPGGAGTWERRSHSGAGATLPYFVYTPPGLDAKTAAPLLVMLHGCTQSAADLAAGTRMNELADRHGFVVAYPEQAARHNGQGCWNWFVRGHQQRGSGEPALLAGLTQEAMASTSGAGVDPKRAFLAGMSAGGAMAAVMGATYPRLFAAVGIHSGLPYGAAASQDAAFEVMARGGRDPALQGRHLHAAMNGQSRVVPTVVVHGSSDRIVCPVNGDQVVGQWLVANGLAAEGRFDADPNQPSTVVHGQVTGGHSYTRYRWNDRGGRPVQEYLRVNGLGHAWSGGSPNGSYTDSRGPDAAVAMWDFFTDVAGSR